MKEAVHPQQRTTPLPIRQPSKRQLQRKYYSMRRHFFQGLHDFRKEKQP
jgi:hypothetical protein